MKNEEKNSPIQPENKTSTGSAKTNKVAIIAIICTLIGIILIAALVVNISNGNFKFEDNSSNNNSNGGLFGGLVSNEKPYQGLTQSKSKNNIAFHLSNIDDDTRNVIIFNIPGILNTELTINSDDNVKNDTIEISEYSFYDLTTDFNIDGKKYSFYDTEEDYVSMTNKNGKLLMDSYYDIIHQDGRYVIEKNSIDKYEVYYLLFEPHYDDSYINGAAINFEMRDTLEEATADIDFLKQYVTIASYDTDNGVATMKAYDGTTIDVSNITFAEDVILNAARKDGFYVDSYTQFDEFDNDGLVITHKYTNDEGTELETEFTIDNDSYEDMPDTEDIVGSFEFNGITYVIDDYDGASKYFYAQVGDRVMEVRVYLDYKENRTFELAQKEFMTTFSKSAQ